MAQSRAATDWPDAAPAVSIASLDRQQRPPIITRRRLEIALGLLWLLDGALQFQPYMFTDAFFKDIWGMANMGLPGPVATLDYDLARMFTAHPVAWNAVFASFQVGLGLGLLWRRTATIARAASIAWALGVWVVGEGFGGMFMGGSSLVIGAPGAALLYALAGVLLWPGRRYEGAAVADAGVGGPALARWAWVTLWTGTAFLELEAANHTGSVPAAQLANGGEDEPSALAALNHLVGHLVGSRGTAFAVGVGLTAVAVGLGVVWPQTRRAALARGMLVATVVWVVGQDLGAVMTGQGTDPGTAPLVVLLALVLWPRHVRPEPAVSELAATGTLWRVGSSTSITARSETEMRLDNWPDGADRLRTIVTNRRWEVYR